MMEEACVIWDQLLEQLAAEQRQFLSLLTDKMAAQLIAPQHVQSPNDTFREGISMWLEHIYTSRFWHQAAKRSGLDDTAIISTCLQNPNKWTVRLASSITQRSNREQVQQFFGPLVAEAQEDLDFGTRAVKERLESATVRDPHGFDGWQKLQRSWGK